MSQDFGVKEALVAGVRVLGEGGGRRGVLVSEVYGAAGCGCTPFAGGGGGVGMKMTERQQSC